MVVCADGGAQVCTQAGIVPEAIIGDLDSLEERGEWEKKTKVFELSEQVTTDFEKCLYSVEAPNTVCLGVIGKRLDHTLAALDVLARYSTERELVIVGEVDLILAADNYFAFEVDEGARVSIHPILPVLFERSKGLEFALDGLHLSPGYQLGTSNRAQGGVFEIVPMEGQIAPYLVIIEKKYIEGWLYGAEF
ncbi:MAG: thiamine diphosphokinase [Devosiaceae bacterium]|nr:thiamine diphosphokinase [Devosiaceae bacterium]